MGMFLMLAGVAKSNVGEVETALQDYAREKSGFLTPVDAGAEVDEDEVMVIAGSGRGHVTVVYPSSIPDWDEASQHLSATLNKPVFSLHIHDSDLWMYILFVSGEEVDRFNPIPDYWEEHMSDEDIQSWAGDAAVVCRHWPEVSKEQIANYMVRWELDNDEDYEAKVYPEDKHGHEDWQMLDFMNKLGLVYPLDEAGSAIGNKYRLKIKE